MLSEAYKIYNQDGLYKLAQSMTTFLHYRTILPLKVYFRKQKNVLMYDNIADPYKVLWIPPSQVSQIQGDFQQNDLGRIVEGNWDLRSYSIIQLSKYHLVRLHFEEGYTWDEIIDHYLIPEIDDKEGFDGELIQEEIPSQYEEGEFDGYTTKDEIRTRYKKIQQLCESIQKEGYKSHKELSESRLALNHVGVNIGRDGEFLFSGSGIHRLSIAKMLDIDEIPVQVWVRHKQWQKIRERVSKTDNVPKEYKGHPDLDDTIG